MTEIRKVGVEDINYGPSTTTWTSSEGTVLYYVPYPYAGSALESAAVIDVRAYNAKGDGSDDTAAIQAAITAASAGDVLFFPPPSSYYGLTDTITVNKALTIIGHRSEIRQATAAKRIFNVSVSNVEISGLKLVGPQFAISRISSEICINAEGASAAAPITGIKIFNNEINTWGGMGIRLKFVNEFQISGNYIYDIYYAGILGYSCIGGIFYHNRVKNIIGTPLAYGIGLSREEDDSITDHPRSSHVSVIGNTVEDVINWEGIDTHGASMIAVVGNTVRGCDCGIAIVSADNGSQVQTWAPLDTTVSGNVIDSEVTDGSKSYGIAFVGANGNVGTPTEKATGAITGNTIRGHGDQSNNISAAIYVRDTQGLTISGNSVIEPSPMGINLYHDNYGFSVTGNTFVDPWSNSYTVPSGIHVRSDYNTGYIGENSVTKDAKSATYVAINCVRIENDANNSISLGQNYSEATNLLYDQGNRASTVFPKSAAVVDVRAYGATGDGVTDDTTAIQAAITAAVAGNGHLMGVGTFITSSPIDLTGLRWVHLDKVKKAASFTGSEMFYVTSNNPFLYHTHLVLDGVDRSVDGILFGNPGPTWGQNEFHIFGINLDTVAKVYGNTERGMYFIHGASSNIIVSQRAANGWSPDEVMLFITGVNINTAYEAVGSVSATIIFAIEQTGYYDNTAYAVDVSGATKAIGFGGEIRAAAGGGFKLAGTASAIYLFNDMSLIQVNNNLGLYIQSGRYVNGTINMEVLTAGGMKIDDLDYGGILNVCISGLTGGTGVTLGDGASGTVSGLKLTANVAPINDNSKPLVTQSTVAWSDIEINNIAGGTGAITLDSLNNTRLTLPPRVITEDRTVDGTALSVYRDITFRGDVSQANLAAFSSPSSGMTAFDRTRGTRVQYSYSLWVPMSILFKTPASAGAAGFTGDVAFDATYAYYCIADNTWRRVQHDTW